MKINPLLAYVHMEMIAAVVDANGLVKNIIVADENSPIEDGTQLIPINEDQFVSIGFVWDGEKFIDNQNSPIL